MGRRRRSAASASRARVSSFSLTSSASRREFHSCSDTTAVGMVIGPPRRARTDGGQIPPPGNIQPNGKAISVGACVSWTLAATRPGSCGSEGRQVAKDHGPSVKNDKQYEGLREEGDEQEPRGGDRQLRGLLEPRRQEVRLAARSSKSSPKQGGTTQQKKAAGRKGGKATAKQVLASESERCRAARQSAARIVPLRRAERWIALSASPERDRPSPPVTVLALAVAAARGRAAGAAVEPTVQVASRSSSCTCRCRLRRRCRRERDRPRDFSFGAVCRGVLPDATRSSPV